MQTKLCTKCNIVKPLDRIMYYKGRVNGKLYYRGICKDCHNAKGKLWKKNNPEKADQIMRKSKLKLNYGIIQDDYDRMLKYQNNQCAICKKSSDKRLQIDHCHNTNKIRGLLCFNCNTGLGKFEDNIEFIERAALYIKGE
jgi:hypothetical protein